MRRILRGYIVNQGGMLNVEVVEVVEKNSGDPYGPPLSSTTLTSVCRNS